MTRGEGAVPGEKAVIGVLNGADIVDFDRKVLLSHVLAGTLG